MVRKNALWNCRNPYQGDFKRVLCICSAGLLRSPTIAYVLSNKDCNTRAAGVYDYALIPVDEVLLAWADEVVFADQEHYEIIKERIPEGKVIQILNIPDNYEYRNEELIKIIEQRLVDAEKQIS